MVEIDVQQTADDRLVVFHDADLVRTTDGRGPLWSRTLAELRSLDAGAWFGPEFAGARIPTLEEVLDACRGRVVVNIEMKMHGHERNIVDRVVGVVHDSHDGDRCLVTSFDHGAALGVKRRAPDLRAGLILGSSPVPEGVFTSAADVLSARSMVADETFLSRAAAAGKAVHVWTVDDPARMAGLVAAGVEAVITNFPDRFPRSG